MEFKVIVFFCCFINLTILHYSYALENNAVDGNHFALRKLLYYPYDEEDYTRYLLIVLFSVLGVELFFLICGILLILKYGGKKVTNYGRVISLPSQPQQQSQQHQQVFIQDGTGNLVGQSYPSNSNIPSQMHQDINYPLSTGIANPLYNKEVPPPYEG